MTQKFICILRKVLLNPLTKIVLCSAARSLLPKDLNGKYFLLGLSIANSRYYPTVC